VEQELAQRKLPAWRRLFARPETGVLARAGDAWWAETFIQLAGMTSNPNTRRRGLAESNPWLAWWCVQEGRKVEPDTVRIIQERSELLVDSNRADNRRSAVQALLKVSRARVIDPLAKLAIDTDASVAGPARQALEELADTGRKAVARVFETRLLR